MPELSFSTEPTTCLRYREVSSPTLHTCSISGRCTCPPAAAWRRHSPTPPPCQPALSPAPAPSRPRPPPTAPPLTAAVQHVSDLLVRVQVLLVERLDLLLVVGQLLGRDGDAVLVVVPALLADRRQLGVARLVLVSVQHPRAHAQRVQRLRGARLVGCQPALSPREGTGRRAGLVGLLRGAPAWWAGGGKPEPRQPALLPPAAGCIRILRMPV